MKNTVFVREYSLPPFDKREILRYAGARSDAPEVVELMESCLDEVQGVFSGRVCYSEYPMKAFEDSLDLGFCKTESKGLCRALEGCESIILFAATVGVGIDRLIARYSLVSPARSLMLQAIGTERAEALCDIFCREIAAEKAKCGLVTRPRFSPGYGDLPLEMQRDIFAALDCPKHIGVSLGESLLMSPSKSVTAIMGVTK